MRLTNLRPFVPSGVDFGVAKQFFKHIGFIENWGNDDVCELQFGEAKFLLQNYSNSEMQENYMIYVDVDNLDDFYQHLLDLNLSERFPTVRFSAPKDMPWGIRELHLIDTAGVCWHFA